MKKQQEHEESGEKAPLWIISFADMISLLMAFFVMLQTMAAEKTNEFLTDGRERIQIISGEFRRNIDNFGVPGLFGKPAICTSFRTSKDKSSLDSPDEEAANPAVDGREEKIRRLFSELSSMAQTHISQFKERELIFEPAPITFFGENTDLNDKAKTYLAQFASTLRQTSQMDKTVVYIVGLGPDIASPQKQWIISELRARAVKSFLQSLLPEKDADNILWWGAGPDMDGVNPSATTNTLPYILVATESLSK